MIWATILIMKKLWSTKTQPRAFGHKETTIKTITKEEVFKLKRFSFTHTKMRNFFGKLLNLFVIIVLGYQGNFTTHTVHGAFKSESIGKPCSSKFEEYTQRIDPHEL